MAVGIDCMVLKEQLIWTIQFESYRVSTELYKSGKVYNLEGLFLGLGKVWNNGLSLPGF